jgi:hypothetical protein
MPNTYHNIFISSKNRQANENVYDFVINFQTANISCNENQYMAINVVSFDMMNTMYNVNSNTKNNTFKLTINSSDTIYTIPYGNYNVYTFMDAINTLLNGLIKLTYNPAQNSYTFSKTALDANNYYIDPLNAYKFFGFKGKKQITMGGMTGEYVNMVNYNKVILRVSNINFDYFTFENIRDPNSFVENSDILFMVSKQDVEPFKMISYNNADASTSFHYNLFDKNLDFIELKLTNENDEPILDASDYILNLQIILKEKQLDLLTVTTLKILETLKDIKLILLQGLRFFGFFNDIK